MESPPDKKQKLLNIEKEEKETKRIKKKREISIPDSL